MTTHKNLKNRLPVSKFRALKLLILVVLISIPVLSKGIIVFVNQSLFKHDASSSYVELYLKIPISSLNIHEISPDKYQSSVKISIKYTQGDSIFVDQVYYLQSPAFQDTLKLDYALLELKRYILPYGNFKMDLLIEDEYNKSNSTDFSSSIDTRFSNSIINFSDVAFADTLFKSVEQTKFSRNQFTIIPNVFNVYSVNSHHISFYTEVYNVNQVIKDDYFFIKYYLKKGEKFLDIKSTIKQKPSSVNPLAATFRIADLTAGEYELIVEVFSKRNKLLKSKTAGFEIRQKEVISNMRANKQAQFKNLLSNYSESNLISSLNYVYHLCNQKELDEAELLIMRPDTLEMRSFMYRFWMLRDSNDPANAWLRYLKRVEESNKMFSTQLREGYLTDRGRVYIQYGPPNNLIESTSPSIAYPYQIWHYYHLPPSQNNKKFIFFNKTGSLDEFELLHSTAVGEPKNPNWKKVINKYNHNIDFEEGVFGDFLDDDFDQ